MERTLPVGRIHAAVEAGFSEHQRKTTPRVANVPKGRRFGIWRRRLRPMLGRIIEKAVGRSRLYARRLLARFPMFRSPTLPAAPLVSWHNQVSAAGKRAISRWRGTRAVIRSTPRPDSSDFDSYRVDRDPVGSVAANAGKGREGGILGSKEFHQSPRPSPSRPYRRRHPDEQCRHLVGPIGCRSLRARSGRTPPSPALPITFTRMRASRTNALRSPLSAPHSWQITSAPRPRCRREAVDLPSGRAFLVVLRPMRLLAVRYLKRSSKRCWGWARQHRQRGDMLWIAVGEQPGEAATPIMANQMKRRSPCPVAATKWSAPPISRNGHRATVGSSRRSPGLTAGP